MPEEKNDGAEITSPTELEKTRNRLAEMLDGADKKITRLIEEIKEEILGCPIDNPILPDGIGRLDEIKIIATLGILEGYIPFEIKGCDLPASRLCKLIRETTIDGDKRRHFYRYRDKTGQKKTFCSDELREKLLLKIAKLEPLPPEGWQTVAGIWQKINEVNKEVSIDKIRQRANRIAGDDQKGIYRKKGLLRTYTHFAPEVIRALCEEFAPALVYRAAPAGWEDVESLATKLKINPQELLEISEEIEGETEKPQKYLSPDEKRAVLHFSPQAASHLRTCIENLCAPPGWQSKEEILEELKIWTYGDTRKGIIEEALEDLNRTDNEKTYLNKTITIRRRTIHYSPAVVTKARKIFERKKYKPEYRDGRVEILRADFIDEREIPANLEGFLGRLPQDFIVKSIAACEKSLDESENDLRPKEYFMHEKRDFCTRTFFPKPFIEKLKEFIIARLTRPNPQWKTFQELRDELQISPGELGKIIADVVRIPIEPEIKFESYDGIHDYREKQVKFLDQNHLLADHFSPALCTKIRQINSRFQETRLRSVTPAEATAVTQTVIKLGITQLPEETPPRKFFQIKEGPHKPPELDACRLEIIPTMDARYTIVVQSQAQKKLPPTTVLVKNHGEKDEEGEKGDDRFEPNYWIIERALLEDYTGE